MLSLHPLPPSPKMPCPACGGELSATGWAITGMRNIARSVCCSCGESWWSDLPTFQGLLNPCLLSERTGRAFSPSGNRWFSAWLEEGYAHRKEAPRREFHVEKRHEVRNPVLLNCLDTLYGHCLLKLLAAQYYLDNAPGIDLIVLCPEMLTWAIPEGVAEVWSVKQPLRSGTEWNEFLAQDIAAEVSRWGSCDLAVAPPQLHPDFFDIRRFTTVEPFPVDDWAVWRKAGSQPVVTFMWREDRLWGAGPATTILPTKLLRRGWHAALAPLLELQRRRLISFAEGLRQKYPSLDFAVAGTTTAGRLPPWIKDLRNPQPDGKQERDWCQRFARSHLVIGLHGSHMILPTAHAGGSIILMPKDRWANRLQDVGRGSDDWRMAALRTQLLPQSVSIKEMIVVADSMLGGQAGTMLRMDRRFSGVGQIQLEKLMDMEKNLREDG